MVVDKEQLGCVSTVYTVLKRQKYTKKRGCWSPREDNEEAARFVGVPHCSSPVLVSENDLACKEGTPYNANPRHSSAVHIFTY